MKKFVFLYQGHSDPTQDVMDAWMGWFASIEDSIVDSGNPLGPGREVTPTQTTELPTGLDATTGYSIVNADGMVDAEKLLVGCPIISRVRIYEAMAM